MEFGLSGRAPPGNRQHASKRNAACEHLHEVLNGLMRPIRSHAVVDDDATWAKEDPKVRDHAAANGKAGKQDMEWLDKFGNNLRCRILTRERNGSLVEV